MEDYIKYDQKLTQDPSMNRSRLSKRLENQTKKNLFYSIFGIIVIVLLVIKFGIPFLANFTSFISGVKTEEIDKKNAVNFIPPPVLNPIPSSTSSAEIVVSGIATEGHLINLYINDDLIDKNKAGKDGGFSFRVNINSGENLIKAKAAIDQNESEFSNFLITTFNNKPPSLSISTPKDGESFSKDQNYVDVSGATDPGVKITVNSFWAITNKDNNFSYRLPIQNGENVIKIVAEDAAGNKTEKEIKINYNQ